MAIDVELEEVVTGVAVGMAVVVGAQLTIKEETSTR